MVLHIYCNISVFIFYFCAVENNDAFDAINHLNYTMNKLQLFYFMP